MCLDRLYNKCDFEFLNLSVKLFCYRPSFLCQIMNSIITYIQKCMDNKVCVCILLFDTNNKKIEFELG